MRLAPRRPGFGHIRARSPTRPTFVEWRPGGSTSDRLDGSCASCFERRKRRSVSRANHATPGVDRNPVPAPRNYTVGSRNPRGLAMGACESAIGRREFLTAGRDRGCPVPVRPGRAGTAVRRTRRARLRRTGHRLSPAHELQGPRGRRPGRPPARRWAWTSLSCCRQAPATGWPPTPWETTPSWSSRGAIPRNSSSTPMNCLICPTPARCSRST